MDEEGQAILDDARRRLATPPTAAERGQIVYLLDPADAYSLYQAAWDKWVHHQCPEGLLFNPNTNVCDFPQAVPENVNPAPR
jgi:hypothetical protein